MENRFHLLNKVVPLAFATHTLFKERHVSDRVRDYAEVLNLKALQSQDLAGRLWFAFIGYPTEAGQDFTSRVSAALDRITGGLTLHIFPTRTLTEGFLPFTQEALPQKFWQDFDPLPHRTAFRFLSKEQKAFKKKNQSIILPTKVSRQERSLQTIKEGNHGTLWCAGVLLTGDFTPEGMKA